MERLHRQLKASLIARLDTTSWSEELPWVLLGLRSVPRDELGASVAELVYGTPLLLPGEFVAPSAEDTKPTPAILQQLRETIRKQPYIPATRHGVKATRVPRALLGRVRIHTSRRCAPSSHTAL